MPAVIDEEDDGSQFQDPLDVRRMSPFDRARTICTTLIPNIVCRSALEGTMIIIDQEERASKELALVGDIVGSITKLRDVGQALQRLENDFALAVERHDNFVAVA